MVGWCDGVIRPEEDQCNYSMDVPRHRCDFSVPFVQTRQSQQHRLVERERETCCGLDPPTAAQRARKRKEKKKHAKARRGEARHYLFIATGIVSTDSLTCSHAEASRNETIQQRNKTKGVG
mmetsp:Transcript_17954/g.49760  ORF Transcript_17954/g.49760 Transcript_17954/m.49760 type:complete len:121 (+) Transcript_17954:164-526(+)